MFKKNVQASESQTVSCGPGKHEIERADAIVEALDRAAAGGAQTVEYVRQFALIAGVHGNIEVAREGVRQFRPGMEHAIANGMVVEQVEKLSKKNSLRPLAVACQAGRLGSFRHGARMFCGVSHELLLLRTIGKKPTEERRARFAKRLVSPYALYDRGNGPCQDLQIEPKGPPVDVFHIHFHPGVEADGVAPVHLPQAGDTGLHAESSPLPVLGKESIIPN